MIETMHTPCCSDVIISTMGSQITSLRIVFSTVYLGVDQSKHQRSTSLTFVRGIQRVSTTEMFPFDDVIMQASMICKPGVCYAFDDAISSELPQARCSLVHRIRNRTDLARGQPHWILNMCRVPKHFSIPHARRICTVSCACQNTSAWLWDVHAVYVLLAIGMTS